MAGSIVPPPTPAVMRRGLGGREMLTVLASLAVVLLLARLGVWQLDRGNFKEQRAAQMARREQLPPLQVTQKPLHGRGIFWRPALARGQWAGQWTVYLQNRQYQGVSGFQVLTPLRLQGSDMYLMVERGWAAPDVHAPLLVPAVPTPSGPVEVRGRIAPPPSQWFSFDKDPPDARVRQNVNLQQFGAYHHIRLLPYVVQQGGSAADGLVRVWPQPPVSAQTNFGYAAQWFAMSAVCLGMLLFFTLRTLLRRRAAFLGGGR